MLLSLVSNAQVVISEFMAQNDSTLLDGDGNYSDWIELYNTGDEAVDLTGWYLSDDTSNPTQWTFPAKSIAAGGHLIVFASGQDEDNAEYTDSLGYLHTTFKLGGKGESVVLTQSDGTTIEHSIIDYPEQSDDVSYGLAQDSGYSYLVVEEQKATVFVGTSEPSSTWNTTSFDDSAWSSGETGVGYDEGSTYDSMINLDLDGTMFVDSTRPPTMYKSSYIRVSFTVADATSISQLALRMKYDDGFVAYINGTEVASANAPDSPTYASSATAEHEGTAYENFTILNASSHLQTGENVLAIHGLAYPFDPRTSSGYPDFFIMPKLTGVTAGDIQTDSAVYFSNPTPGADNVFGVLGYVGDTSFSVDRGFFTDAFDVEISCDTEGAKIYYTTDGTTPTTDNGTLYTGAITIAKTTVLRAAAFVTGYQPSDTDTQTYIFLDDVISQGTSVSSLDPDFPSSSVNGQSFDYGMDTDITQSSTYSGQIEGALKAIPSISIVTDPDNLFDTSTGIYVNAEEEGEAWERETSIELINPDRTDGFQINCGIRIRGESSASSSNPKHSFRFLFKSEYGAARLNYPLFGDRGADSFKRMDLRTGQNFSWANQSPQYATWLYDIFTRDTHRDMNQPHTRGEFYHLYINGMYWGLYQTEERCDSRYAASYYGGDNDDYDAVKADGDTGDMYAVDGTRDAYEDLWAGMTAGVSDNASYFALQGLDSAGADDSSLTKLLDVDNVIDYMLLIYFTANRDSPIGPPNQATMPRNLNLIYNRTNPDGFKFVAHDNEHSLEISEGVSHNRFTQSLSSSFDGIDRMTPWWMHLKLMNNAEYALRFADHVHEHFYNNGTLTATKTAARLETRKNEIYAAVVAESARWGDSASSSPRTRDGDWLDCVDWLLNTYMSQRTAIVLSQIVAKGWYPSVAAPEFNQHGGSIDSGFSLTISGSGTIYYTTDGSDPREVGGGVAGTTYSSAITLNHSAQLKARVLSGGVWSALTKATFVLNETSPLRITEIMYNPASGTDYSSSDFEFIEIQNTSDETVGLAGTEFTAGIVFDFTEGDVSTLAPGDYVILVSNLDAFKSRYSNWADLNIAGEYQGKFYISSGSLDNGGETITLVDGLGNTILDFEYDDSWVDITDGEGYSLTLLDSSADTSTWNESSSWRASKYTGGTPGEAPEDFLCHGDLVINEILTHQDNDTPGDWIELYNASDDTIDINGWFLSDDEDDLAKVELSGLPTIAPGGYLVLTEASHFGTTADASNGFALSELGETIYLSSGEGNELTGYRIEQEFGASERDVTFGRYTNSDGTVDFTAQSEQTYGATNAYPLVDEVVFTEIMYHPADSGGFEYIEICNASSSSVSLYHATYTTNTWKLEGAVEFTFPEGLTLASGECVIVSETDAATFTAYYTVDAGVTVLGPYEGQLNNAGEALYLTRPGDPEELTGEIPYYVVELVDYDDEAPWPTEADGLGSSLERIDAVLYPNDSENWTANETPSPGTADVDLDSEAPSITTQPTAQTVDPGDTVSFTVVASGTATLSYQWQKDEVDISGATSATYSIAEVAATDEGSFRCVVSNTAGSATSDTAALSVNEAPVFTSTPTTTATEDVTYQYAVSTSDVDGDDSGDDLSISSETKPDWLTMTDNGDGTATLAGTPDDDDVGSNAVTLRVTDDGGAFSEQSFTIVVDGVNDAPEITGQATLTTYLETALTITLDDLVVADPDNAYPDDFTLMISDGTNYTRTLNTITPVADFLGVLTVPATVSDGSAESEAFLLSVTVTEATIALDIYPGWNLLSFPFNPASDVSVLTLLADSDGSELVLSPCWTWDVENLTYVNVESGLLGGQGFWVKSAGESVATTASISALALSDESQVLNTGWNLIGPTDECTVPTNNAIACIWCWDAEGQTYNKVTAEDTLEPGKGYWIYAIDEGCVIETGGN
jgi:plastocyanin